MFFSFPNLTLDEGSAVWLVFDMVALGIICSLSQLSPILTLTWSKTVPTPYTPFMETHLIVVISRLNRYG
jgi:hypothetical protein